MKEDNKKDDNKNIDILEKSIKITNDPHNPKIVSIQCANKLTRINKDNHDNNLPIQNEKNLKQSNDGYYIESQIFNPSMFPSSSLNQKSDQRDLPYPLYD